MRPASLSLPRQLLLIVGMTCAILLAPLAAMQFSDEVAWSVLDFTVAGVLLSGTGVLYLLAARSLTTRGARIAAGCVLAAMLFVVWMELAVGVFGSSLAGS